VATSRSELHAHLGLVSALLIVPLDASRALLWADAVDSIKHQPHLQVRGRD